MLDLVARTRPTPQPTTPPPSHPSFTSSFQQTPWSFNTGGFEDTSEYRKHVDDPLREELLPSLRIDIPNFFDAVFGQVPQLEGLAETNFRLCQEEDTPLYNEGSGWSQWPSKAEEKAVLGWLQELMDHLTAWVRKHSTRATVPRYLDLKVARKVLSPFFRGRDLMAFSSFCESSAKVAARGFQEFLASQLVIRS